jgi:stalled ribosome rescue protein Dom34
MRTLAATPGKRRKTTMANTSAKPGDIEHAHAIVWIDHLKAKIFPMGLSGVGEVVVHAHLDSDHLHHSANVIGSGRVREDKSFLPKVAESLQSCRDILIVGPGIEKSALLHYLKENRTDLTATELHAETSDHPTDREIIALGRRRFGLD